MPPSSIDEQLSLLKFARAWLVEHTHEPEVPDSSVRGVWLPIEQVLMVEFRHGEQTQRVFLSGWMGHCRWAVEQAGHVQLMPPHVDPGLPIWNDQVAWAQPWRGSLPRDVLETLEPLAVGRWAMLYWASRSPSALKLLRENARVLWLMVLTAEQENWTAHHLNQALAGDPYEMLMACGVVRPEWAGRFLKRIPMMAYHRDSYRRLIERLRHPKHSTTGHDAHEPANPVSRASTEATERTLALFIVCPETLDDVTHALAWVIHSDFENSLRLVLLPDPLAHEGAEKQHLARLASSLLKPRVDAVIHINSQRLTRELGADWHPELVQAKIHETFTQCVKSLADTIHRVGLIGVDFVDVRNCLEQQGDAWVAMGRSDGPDRAERATQQAVQGLQIDCELFRAQFVIICVTGGLDMLVDEFGQVTNVIQSAIPETADCVISSVIDPDMPPGQLQVMVIAAGIEPGILFSKSDHLSMLSCRNVTNSSMEQGLMHYSTA